MQLEKPSIKRTSLAALGVIFDRKKQITKALLFPFILYFFLDLVHYFNQVYFLSWVLWFLELMLCTVLSVLTHRVILLGSSPNDFSSYFLWSRRESYFVLYFILIIIILYGLPNSFSLLLIEVVSRLKGIGTILYINLITYSRIVGMIIGALLSFYLIARISLVFPAIAIDRDITINNSWRMTKDHQLLIIFICIVIPLLFSIPGLLVSLIPYSYWLESIFSTIALVFTVGFLSIGYLEISDYEYKS